MLSPRYFRFFSLISIVGLGFIVYSNTFLSPFHFDDFVTIVNNFSIRNIQDLQNIWFFFPRRFIGFLSIACSYHFNQLNVFGYHLFNLTVHLVAAVLVYWLTRLTLSTPAMKKERIAGQADLIALFAGLVFVSHPVQTQAVTYIMQRTTSMAALFYVATLCFYVKSRLLQDGKPNSGLGKFYYSGSLMTAILAMFTKETAITLPLTILLYEYSFLKTRKDFPWRSLIPFLFALFIIPLTTLLTESLKAQQTRVVWVLGPTDMSSMDYLLTQFRVMSTYIRLLFLPLNQNLDYDYSISRRIFELPVLFSFLFLSTLFSFAVRSFSKHRLISFSIFWFFLTLLPEASLLPLSDIIFEHRIYLPSVGFSIFLVSGAYYLLVKDTVKVMVMALMAVVAFYSVLTYQRNEIWKDDLVLWNDTVRKSPYKARPYVNRGGAYVKQGDLVQALFDYNKAIAIDPKDGDAYAGRGDVYGRQGNLVQALSDYNKAIAINPNNGVAYYNRGIIHDGLGNFTQALSDYSNAIAIDPNLPDEYNNRGVVYLKQGDLARALSDYNKAIAIDPDNGKAYKNRAVLYYQLKEYGMAWSDVYKAEELGAVVNPAFLSALKQQASGREK